MEWGADANKTPLVLTRAWCAFELYTTLTAGADLDVVLPPGGDAELDAAIAADLDAQVAGSALWTPPGAMHGRSRTRRTSFRRSETGMGLMQSTKGSRQQCGRG